MKELISYHEALDIVLGSRIACGARSVPLDQAANRIVAKDIFAAEDIPPFDNSAMDGYAIISSDTRVVPVTLRVVDEIPAGSVPTATVVSGTCSQIMTGAVMPNGADAIVPVEQTVVDGDKVTLSATVDSGQNLRRAGGDIARGSKVVNRGTVLTPVAIGVLASIGADPATVVEMPSIAIVATGDELVEPSSQLSPGKIRNSNGPTLASQAAAVGATVIGPFVSRDSRASVQRVLGEIESADIFVFAGGVSVGEFDFVQEALEQRGMETLFWRVRQRPGKPLLFGRLGGVPVFGLPGNPVSASVCFEMYVRPLIEQSAGLQPRPTVAARLGEAVDKKPGLHYFARGVARSEDGVLTVNLAGSQASNVFSTMVKANCIVHLTEGRERLEIGEVVQIAALPWLSLF